MSRLSSLISARSACDPDGVAFIQDDKPLSNLAFALMVERMASWLSHRGVKRGDAVAVWLLNSPQWIALFFAVARLGGITVPINTRYRSEEVAFVGHERCAAIDHARKTPEI